MILILLIAAVLFALGRFVAERFDKAQPIAAKNAGARVPTWTERCRTPGFQGQIKRVCLNLKSGDRSQSGRDAVA